MEEAFYFHEGQLLLHAAEEEKARSLARQLAQKTQALSTLADSGERYRYREAARRADNLYRYTCRMTELIDEMPSIIKAAGMQMKEQIEQSIFETRKYTS